MSDTEWLVRMVLVLGAGTIGFFLNVWWQGSKDRREGQAAKYAIQAEMDAGARDAEAYLQPSAVKRVGWRLSLRMYESGLPKLMQAGIKGEQSAALVAYYQNVEAFNRSLDQIEEHTAAARQKLVHDEVGRAHLKAIEIASSEALRALTKNPACPPGLSARIDEKLAKRDGRTLYDIARGQSGFF